MNTVRSGKRKGHLWNEEKASDGSAIAQAATADKAADADAVVDSATGRDRCRFTAARRMLTGSFIFVVTSSAYYFCPIVVRLCQKRQFFPASISDKTLICRHGRKLLAVTSKNHVINTLVQPLSQQLVAAMISSSIAILMITFTDRVDRKKCRTESIRDYDRAGNCKSKNGWKKLQGCIFSDSLEYEQVKHICITDFAGNLRHVCFHSFYRAACNADAV